MSLKSLIQKLDQLNEGIMDEPATKDTPTGRVHKAKAGGYGRKDDEDSEGKKVKQASVARGRGRPKKDAGSDGEVANWDASALNSVFGGKKPKTLPGKASVKHKIKDNNDELDEAQNGPDKKDIPAWKRKEKGGDWRVSQADLEKEKDKRISDAGTLAKNSKGEIDENLDPEQKKVGQLGPYDKVGKKGAVGKLVGANESIEQGVAEGRVDQLPTRGADYSKYDTAHLKMMLRPGIMHRDEAKFKALIRKELKKREQQGVSEGSEEGFSIEDMVMDQYRNGNDVWEIASNMGMSQDEVQDIINDSEQGVTEAGNKPLGSGDTRSPRELKTQMQGASDEFVRNVAGTKTGPFHSKVAKMQGKLAKSEVRRREQGVGESYPKHQDLSGISTDKLKSYLDKQSQKQGSGEGNQIKRVRSELQRRQQGVSEGFTYAQKHTSWSVHSPKKNEFNKTYKLDQEKEARAHAERIGGKLVKVDQYGHSIRANKKIAEGAVKKLMMDLESLTDKEFLEKYKKTKKEMRAEMKQKVSEGEKVKTKTGTIHKGTYGYGDEKEEKATPKGRGRPKKDATPDGEGGPKFNDDAKSFFGVGKIAYKDLPGKPGKKHKLKDWIEHIEANVISEAALDPSQVAIAAVKAPGSSSTPTASATQPAAQSGTMPTTASAAKPAMGATVLDFKNPNDPLKAAIQQAVKNKQVTALGEEEVDEVITKKTSAGEIIGDFQKSKNPKFAGKSKEERKRMALGAYYGMHPEKSKKEESVMESLQEGGMPDKLKDLLDNYPYEHNNAQEGWGLHENFYQALCDHYWKEGKIPRDVMYGPAERLREFVEDCYGSDTGILNENPLLSMAAGAAGSMLGNAVADEVLDDDVQDTLARFGDEEPSMPPLSPSEIDPTKPTHEIPAFIRKSWEKNVTPSLPESLEDYMGESKMNKKTKRPVKDAQMESWDKQLSAMLAEGMTITTSTGNEGSSDTVSISATDADAQTLMQLLQNSGLMKGQSSSMSTPSADSGDAAITVEPVSADEVMGTLQPDTGAEGDDALGFLKRMLGAREEHSGADTAGAESQDDYEDEDDETCDTCGHSECQCDGGHDHEEEESGEESEDDEEVEEGNAFSGAVAKAKADGIQPGEKITVGGKQYPVKEARSSKQAAIVPDPEMDKILAKHKNAVQAYIDELNDDGYAELDRNLESDLYDYHEARSNVYDHQTYYDISTYITNSLLAYLKNKAKNRGVAENQLDEISPTKDYLQKAELSRKDAENTQRRFSSSPEERAAALRDMKNREKGIGGYSKRLYAKHPEYAPKSPAQKPATSGSDPYAEYSDDYNVYKQNQRDRGLGESAELNEWANSVNDSDEKFLADMEFMTKTISGGLNNIKQDQTVVPSARVKTQGETKHPDLTMAEMLRKMSNIN